MHALLRLFFVLSVLTPLAARAATHAPAGDAPAAWEVYTILQQSCAECHGGHLARPKGKLGYILDLPRLIDEAYVLPGDPDKSDLYTSMATDDPDLRMPPEDAEVPFPTPEQIALVHRWIASGASLPEIGAGVDELFADDAVDATAPAPANTGAQSSGTTQRLGRLHVLFVHFPLALLLCAGGAELLRLRWRDSPGLGGFVRGAVWIGALGAIAATGTGWLHAEAETFGGLADRHRWLGVACSCLALLAVVSERRTAKPGSGRKLFRIVLGALVAIVILTGHTGGALTHGQDFLGWF
ncbi:hypothetical protein ASA1KI_39980 [Opitutales bacterium ASA1]|uniref:c-type cytochrome domain-containing protein n=1 Tax=Congregicoccus parvus TaxID=3081749 RepID=UPI002B2BDE67|nr:hypothetical protein ASA1KI_39980 [Opitutales bacterium ASA1]